MPSVRLRATPMSMRAVRSARAALPLWRAVPVAERGHYMLAFLDALLAMNDDIAAELAWQMGRPVRYGGEKGGVEERIRAMAALAEEALRPHYPPEKAGFRRYIAREPVGVVHGDRAVELSLSNRDQHYRARRFSPAMPSS